MSRSSRHQALAEKIARANPHLKWKLGAVLTRGKRVLAVGWNTVKTHHAEKRGCGRHAEVAVLNQVEDCEGTTLYVVRVTKGGRVGLAKPCEECWKEIRKRGVKRVVFSR